jgi:hypothetical protein
LALSLVSSFLSKPLKQKGRLYPSLEKDARVLKRDFPEKPRRFLAGSPTLCGEKKRSPEANVIVLYFLVLLRLRNSDITILQIPALSRDTEKKLSKDYFALLF